MFGFVFHNVFTVFKLIIRTSEIIFIPTLFQRFWAHLPRTGFLLLTRPRTTSSLSWLHFLWKHTYGAGGCRSRPLTWWKCAYAQLDSPFKPSTHTPTQPHTHPKNHHVHIYSTCRAHEYGLFRAALRREPSASTSTWIYVCCRREGEGERDAQKNLSPSSDFWSSLTVGRISSHHGALFHPTRVPVVGLSSWKFYEKLWELLQGQFKFLCEDNSPFFKIFYFTIFTI